MMLSSELVQTRDHSDQLLGPFRTILLSDILSSGGRFLQTCFVAIVFCCKRVLVC